MTPLEDHQEDTMPIPVTTWEQRRRYEAIVAEITTKCEASRLASLEVEEQDALAITASARSAAARKRYMEATLRLGELRRELDELCFPLDEGQSA